MMNFLNSNGFSWLHVDFCPLTPDEQVRYDKDFLSHGDKHVSTGSSIDASKYEIILSKEALTKQCYWEVEVSGGRVEMGVSSRAQKSTCADDQMGLSGLFPCLVIYQNKLYGFLQNGKIIGDCPDFDCPYRIGLYLNKNAECLSFYSVCEDQFTLLGKFPSTGFTKVTSAGKLFAACRIYSNSRVKLIESLAATQSLLANFTIETSWVSYRKNNPELFSHKLISLAQQSSETPAPQGLVTLI